MSEVQHVCSFDIGVFRLDTTFDLPIFGFGGPFSEATVTGAQNLTSTKKVPALRAAAVTFVTFNQSPAFWCFKCVEMVWNGDEN